MRNRTSLASPLHYLIIRNVQVIHRLLAHTQAAPRPINQTTAHSTTMRSSSLARIKIPPMVPNPPQPTSPSRAIKQCAQQSLSYLYYLHTFLMSWFTKTKTAPNASKPPTASKAPKARIAGMHITRDQAERLMEICTTLEEMIERQCKDIHSPRNSLDLYASCTLRRIKKQQKEILKTLEDLVYSSKGYKDNAACVEEFYDAHCSMRRIEMRCEHQSKYPCKNWRTAAERYWPLIAERYGPLLGLVANLKKEVADALEDGKTWSGETFKRTHCTNLQSMKSTLNREPWARRTPTSKYIPLKDNHVTFSETVLWRKFNSAAPPKKLHRLAANTLLHREEFTTSLARRGRRSTKSFKKRKVENKG